MNKPLIMIVILSFIYICLISFSPQAQRLNGHVTKLEYGYIDGPSKECNLLSKTSNSYEQLHYFVKRGEEKTRIEFFCVDETKPAVKNSH